MAKHNSAYFPAADGIVILKSAKKEGHNSAMSKFATSASNPSATNYVSNRISSNLLPTDHPSFMPVPATAENGSPSAR